MLEKLWKSWRILINLWAMYHNVFYSKLMCSSSFKWDKNLHDHTVSAKCKQGSHRLTLKNFNDFSMIFREKNLKFPWEFWTSQNGKTQSTTPIAYSLGPIDNQIQWNFNRKSYIFIEENAFENVTWKMAAILFRSQYFYNVLKDILPKGFLEPGEAGLHCINHHPDHQMCCWTEPACQM